MVVNCVYSLMDVEVIGCDYCESFSNGGGYDWDKVGGGECDYVVEDC